MNAGKGKSGKKLGDENVDKLRAYLESVDAIPARAGEPDKTAIARAAGLKDRQPLYKNKNCVELLQEHVDKKPLGAPISCDDAPKVSLNVKEAALERQLRTLENKNDSLIAENFELRRRLKKVAHIEALLEEGKRHIP